MKEDRFWNFSRGERFATIVFMAATIAVILYMHAPLSGGSGDDAITEQYSDEIKKFEEQISLRDTAEGTHTRTTGKKGGKNRIPEQKLMPKIRENGN